MSAIIVGLTNVVEVMWAWSFNLPLPSLPQQDFFFSPPASVLCWGLQLLLLLLERMVLLTLVLDSTDLVGLCQLLPFSGEVALVP